MRTRRGGSGTGHWLIALTELLNLYSCLLNRESESCKAVSQSKEEGKIFFPLLKPKLKTDASESFLF